MEKLISWITGREKRRKRVLAVLDQYLSAWLSAQDKGYGLGRLVPPHNNMTLFEEVEMLRNKIAKIL